MKLTATLAALGAAAIIAGPAAAWGGDKENWKDGKEIYVGGSLGYTVQNDSDNSGRTGAFTTGNGGTAVPFGTAIADGTPYGWSTEFDDGYALSLETGVKSDRGFRSGLELTYQNTDIDKHKNVTLDGGSIDGIDAGALTGSATTLGATVGDVVADGQGSIESTSLFFNGYYDFATGSRFSPYLGAGIGLSEVKVDYSPSGVSIIDDKEMKFAYQLKAGASVDVSDRFEVYGEYAYRATDELEVGNQLFPGTLDIENTSNVFAVGGRLKFGK